MAMEGRIKRILELEGLTNSKFAEMLGIQSSVVSHLLSGRNKPSFDLITKILDRFPQYDSDWFLGRSKDDEPYRAEFRGGGLPQSSSTAPTLFDETTTTDTTQSAEPSIAPPTTPAINGSKSPSFVVVFYSDGSCERFSMR